MATRNINLTEALDQFVEDQVLGGSYQNASEVMRAGLRLLKIQAEQEEARLTALRAAIQVGLDELESGHGIEVQNIDEWLSGLGRGAETR